MSRFTQTLNNTARLLANTNVAAYTLQYLDDSPKHPMGSFETIVMPYIEIGRDRNCAVRFGEDQPFVSRKHVALERKANGVYVKMLATTNPTLLNGRPAQDGQKVQNGDIVQLAYEGPRLKFNISASGTANLGITNRIKLMSQQALRPYRIAIAAISIFALASVLGLGYANYTQRQQIAQQQMEMAQQRQEIANDKITSDKKQERLIDSVSKQSDTKIAQIIEQFKLRGNKPSRPNKTNFTIKSNEEASGSSIDNDQIYFIEITGCVVEYEGETKSIPIGGSGTGFLLDDGRFVTARHVVQPWRFILTDTTMILLNILEQQGAHITMQFEANSPKHKLTLSSDNFIKPDNYDKKVSIKNQYSIRYSNNYITDWAYCNVTDGGSTMGSDANASKNLTRGETLKIIGFPNGQAMQEDGFLNSVYSEAKVGQEGLVNGLITITNMGIDHGNSGGPVFAERNGKWVVVGIVSAGGQKFGYIVPISNIK